MPLQELLGYFANCGDTPGDLTPSLQLGDAGCTGHYRGLSLYSVFQPLLNATTQRTHCHEALLRVRDASGASLSPEAAFALPRTTDEAIHFDRLCRVVHALNFVRQAPSDSDLFVNVSGRHLLGVSNHGHGAIFERLLAMCGLQPRRVILEILESQVDDISHLNDAVAAYRARGYRVAIDDFGSEHSNFDRLWRLTPDIVKLDRSLIVQSSVNERARRILPKIVDIIHELGALVVCEGVETAEQHHLAIDAGADLVQGYFYARPASRIQPGVSHPAPPHQREQSCVSVSPRRSRIANTVSA